MHHLVPGLALGLVLSGAAGATTYVVRPDGSGDFPTIDAAILAVPEGSVIELTDGVFLGEGNRDLLYRGKAIVIRSQNGDPSHCIIDVADVSPHSGFIFQNGEDTLSVLEGVTIRNARNILGAGITCWNGGSPRIVRCILSNNVSTDEDYGGGGIYCTSAPVIEDCRFIDNTAIRGGAMMVRSGAAPVLRGVTFSGNLATAHGGALYLYECVIRAEDCVFQENSAAGTGGAILSGHVGSYTFTRCAFAANTAADGGAVSSSFDGAYAFAHCTFVGNSAAQRGGVVASRRIYDYVFTNCTFSANAAQQGAVLWDQYDSYVKFEQCILAFATRGGAVFCDGVTILPRFTCSDIYGNVDGDWVDCLEGQSHVRGNISLDPLFCAPPVEDLHLMEDSPCAPYAPPHPECPLVGAWPVGCGLPASLGNDLVAGAAPTRLWVGRSFPTPSAASVAIDFGVPASVEGVPLELTIHAATGRLVRTLLSGVQSPGVHRALWDGTDRHGRPVEAGVYFCRLNAGGETAQTRLVWVR
jgi:predicted outer membrane repeat protein